MNGQTDKMNIAVTGEGIISAIGLDKQETLRSLVKRRSGIGEMKHLQSAHHELPVGEVDLTNSQLKEMAGIPVSKLMSRTALMGIIAIRQALADAGITVDAVLERKKKGEKSSLNNSFMMSLPVMRMVKINCRQKMARPR